jgi:hypothetical protein
MITVVRPPKPPQTKKTLVANGKSCKNCVNYKINAIDNTGICMLFHDIDSLGTLETKRSLATHCRSDPELCGPDARYFRSILEYDFDFDF